MTFRVGQKVECIKPSRSGQDWAGENQCIVGIIYTVRSVFRRSGQAEDVIHVEELINPLFTDGIECGFFADRFRPVVERKIDISFAYEILRKASKPARTPAISSPT